MVTTGRKIHSFEKKLIPKHPINLLILAENGTLYPLEIKMTANPKRSMIAAFSVLDNVSGFKRGQGAVICLYDRKLALD